MVERKGSTVAADRPRSLLGGRPSSPAMAAERAQGRRRQLIRNSPNARPIVQHSCSIAVGCEEASIAEASVSIVYAQLDSS